MTRSFTLESPFRAVENFLIYGGIAIVIWTMGDDILIRPNSLDKVTLCTRLTELCQIETPKVVLNPEVKGVVVRTCA